MSLAGATIAAAAALAGGAYADGKLQLSNDITGIRRMRRGEENFKRAVQTSCSPCFELFRINALKHAEHEAIWTRERRFSWRSALEMVCRYESFFRSRGVRRGHFVAFYLTNSPEFIFCWMALLAIGAAPALVNYNLPAEAFVRCVEVADARLVLVDATDDCARRAQAARAEFERRGIEMVMFDDSLKASVESRPIDELPRLGGVVNPSIGLMYTSGSTGLPKAMLVGMQRAYCTASVQRKTFGQQPGPGGDRAYHCMPLYHGTGGLAALIDIMGGLSIAIAPKFSVSRFWIDCIDSQSTIFLYVGETIRYLLASPPSENDRRHKIRMVWGNGLRPDVWTKFQARFGVAEVGEFFASTEGMLTLVNHSRNELSLGAVGHHGWINRFKSHSMYVSVRVDAATGDMYRDPRTSFAERTPLDVGGEILVRVPDQSAWQGYRGAKEATDLKFVRDVLEKGDLFYRTGDALRRTRDGYWYFLDRLGDTYRWKGENVSTTEVSQALGAHPLVAEANVYGVRVPGHEGKAGCVALRLIGRHGSDNWSQVIAAHLRSTLPGYAVPLFIRLVDDSTSMATGNYKHVKGPLQHEGIDPDLKGTRVQGGKEHRMFWRKPGTGEFVEYTVADWFNLQNGTVKL